MIAVFYDRLKECQTPRFSSRGVWKFRLSSFEPLEKILHNPLKRVHKGTTWAGRQCFRFLVSLYSLFLCASHKCVVLCVSAVRPAAVVTEDVGDNKKNDQVFVLKENGTTFGVYSPFLKTETEVAKEALEVLDPIVVEWHKYTGQLHLSFKQCILGTRQ